MKNHRITRVALAIVSLGWFTGLAQAASQADYQAELLETSRGWGTAVADYDNDGHDDVFITGHDGANDRIWYWRPNGWAKSATLAQSDRHDCDAADVDQDGRMDFYCAVGADKGTGDGPNELWMQQAGGIFTKKEAHGAEDSLGSSRRPIFFDFNHDGWPDIYLTNEQHPGGNESINRVFVSQAGQHFSEVTTSGTGSIGWACVAKGDIDGDGWDDLLVCTHDGQSSVLLNNRANDFNTIAPPAVVGKRLIWAQLKDLNDDGKPDLILLADNTNLEVWLNSGSAPYFPTRKFFGKLPQPGKSLTVGDFNHDGQPDIYVALADKNCQDSLQDLADDVVFWGRATLKWDKARVTQGYAGCGHEVQTLNGDQVLLVNGGSAFRGPSYVIDWSQD